MSGTEPDKNNDACSAIIDETGRISRLSLEAARIFGLVPDEAVGRKLFDFVQPDEVHVLRNRIMYLLVAPEEEGQWVLDLRDRPKRILVRALNRLDAPEIGGLLLELTLLKDSAPANAGEEADRRE